jgi:hypothetical protein
MPKRIPYYLRDVVPQFQSLLRVLRSSYIPSCFTSTTQRCFEGSRQPGCVGAPDTRS